LILKRNLELIQTHRFMYLLEKFLKPVIKKR